MFESISNELVQTDPAWICKSSENPSTQQRKQHGGNGVLGAKTILFILGQKQLLLFMKVCKKKKNSAKKLYVLGVPQYAENFEVVYLA